MKKLLLLTKTLLAAVLLCVGQNAWGQTLYSWEGAEGAAKESGGTAAGTLNGLHTTVAGNLYAMQIAGNSSNIGAGGGVTITLTEALQEGDVIRVTGFQDKNASDKVTALYMSFDQGSTNKGNISDDKNWVNLNTTAGCATGTQPETKIYTVTAALAGSNKLTLIRTSGKTGTNLFINKFQIVRTLAGTLVHTASNSCTTSSSEFTNTVDNATEKYHNEGSGTYQGYAFAEYTYSIPAGYVIKNATLSWSATNLNTGNARTSKIYYLNAGKTIDYANMPTTTSLRFNGEKTWIKDVATAKGVSAISDATDVTNAVKAMQAQGSIIFQWTGIAGGANLNGKGASAASQPKLSIELESMSEYIAEHKGDLTGLINGDFSTDAAGWTGGNRITGLARGWKSGSDTNPFYERTTAGTMSYTLSNMPAGTYKVVAAWRSINGGTMTPSIAGTNGSTVTGTGDAAPAVGTKEINMNGVEMPYSNLGGFTTNDLGHNWHWITATGTLAEDGNLVINFTTAGTAGWNAIDDVHLYCTSLGGTSYTTTITEGSAVSNSDGKVVTCDIVLANPNSIITSNEAITTASGAALNNNLVGTNIAQLVLYDGADYTFSMSSAGTYTINNSYGAAKFYRSLTENTYCTICLPFTPAAGSGTYYEPTKLSDGSLTISEVADEDLKPNTPYILKPSGNYNDIWNNNNAGNSEKYNVKYTNNQPATEVDGGKMWFTGRLEKQNVLGSWSGNYYVLGTDNELHKISDEEGSTVAVNPFRAYFYVDGSPSARTISISLGDKVTGVENVEAASEAKAKDGKFVEGNQLFIYKNGVKYNAAGAKLY